MAAGDPILINLPYATFLMQPETGVIVESADREVESKLKEIFNAALGYTAGLVFYDFMASVNWSAIVNGTTGLNLAAPGVALTLANNAVLGVGTLQNGVATGGLYSKNVKFAHQPEDLLKVSGTAMQRAGIS